MTFFNNFLPVQPHYYLLRPAVYVTYISSTKLAFAWASDEEGNAEADEAKDEEAEADEGIAGADEAEANEEVIAGA
jgi:hypothetical protein